MRVHRPIGLLIVALSICHAAEYLAAINELPSDCRREYLVIRQVAADFLTIVGDEQLFRLQRRGIAYSILDSNPRAKVYFLIANSGENYPDLMRRGKRLKRYEFFFLFQTTDKHRENVRETPVRMEQLRFIPIIFEDQESLGPPPARLVPNPLIEQILKEISIDTLRGYVRTLQSFKTRNASTTENKTVVCPWLASILQPFCDSVYQQAVGSYGPNVVGIKKGNANPSLTKYCLIGAHLDAVVTNGPFGAAGADDNASGTAGVLECARVFKRHSFENTVVFALFNAEEAGLVGSGIMAKYMKNNGHSVIGGIVTYDQAGHSSNSTKDILWLESVGNNDANNKFITNYMQGIVDTYLHMKTMYSLQGAGTDYVNFTNSGYIAGMVGEKEYDHPAYHKNFDTLDCPVGMNDMQLFQNIVKTGTAAIADMAVPVAIAGAAGQRPSEAFFTGVRSVGIHGGTIRIAVSRTSDRPFDAALYSPQGRIVRSLGSVSFKGATTVSVPLARRGEPSLSNGIYYLRLSNNTILQTCPLGIF